MGHLQDKGEFVITELSDVRSSDPLSGGPTEFRWSNTHRNSPLQPWSFGVQLRTSRTDYPGGDNPTEQVLGPNFTPFTLNGRWSDKFNFSGYAELTREGFEDMVRRGNRVRLEFQNIQIEGLITECTFDYRRRDDIGYSFTFSPHHRQPGGVFALKGSPRTVLNARQLLTAVAGPVGDAVGLDDRSPNFYLARSLRDDAANLFTAWSDQVTAVADTIDQRVILEELSPSEALLHLAAKFIEIGTTARSFMALLQDKRSDSDLVFENGILSLDFDVWAKGITAEARDVFRESQRAAADLVQRAEPNSKAIYRPQGGESFYAISNRFYGNPHSWRRIAKRNGLDGNFVLSGDEILIIPEAVAR